MIDLEMALKKQSDEVNRLKNCPIYCFHGYGRNHILSFDILLHPYDQEPSPQLTQKRIDENYYSTIEDFDSYYTADISFEDLYDGEQIDIYREETFHNLMDLGKSWRNRVNNEYPEANVIIVLHREYGEWFLDTYNHPVYFDDAVYL